VHDTGTIVAIVVSSLVVLVAGGAVAMYFGRRTRTTSDWMVAGRSLPLYVVVFTQFATAAGGGVLVAHVGIAYTSGLSVFAYEAFVLLGFLVLALIGPWLRKQNFATVPDVLRRLYTEHPVVTGLAALFSIAVPFGWLATQFVAFAKLFSEVTGAPLEPLIILMALISLVFVLPGGLLSVAWSDFLFGVFMLVVSVVIGGYAISMAGGFSGITSAVPEQLWRLPDSLGAAGGSTIWLWLFAIVPGTLTNQLYYQRVFATRDERLARRGLVISGFMTLIAGVYASAIGLSVRAANPDLGAGGAELAAGWFLTQLPVWLLGLYAAFLMATIVSTTGSALQSVVTNLVQDVFVTVSDRTHSDAALVRLSKWLTVAVTVVAAVLAIAFPTALTWLVATYAYSASTLAAPIFVGYLLHKRSALMPRTALAGMIGGLVGCAVAHIAGTTVPYAVYGIVASTVCLLAAHVVLGRRPAEPEPVERPAV
jgi:SSS family solute:Na+ symporter